MEETGRSRGKNSSHWKAWLKDLDIGAIDDADGEILVAEIECDYDENETGEDNTHIPMPTNESGLINCRTRLLTGATPRGRRMDQK